MARITVSVEPRHADIACVLDPLVQETRRPQRAQGRRELVTRSSEHGC
ncbi:hypothetical protein [Streptomyces sp. NPDC097610]